MTDETMADDFEQDETAVAEAETEDTDTEELETESEAETEEETEQEEEAPEEEFEELEFEGKQYQIPKALKSGFMMQADYTRKTQEVAAEKKAIAEQQQRLTQQVETTERELELRANLTALNAQLQEYTQLDWDALEKEDYLGAQSQWRRFQMVKDAVGQIQTELDRQVTERTEQAKQETAKRLQETARFAETQIPGWSRQVDADVSKFATEELGFDWETQLMPAFNPQVLRTLHLAWIGHQALSKSKAKPKPAAKPAPTQTVAAKSAPPRKGTDDRASISDWMAARNRQVMGG